MAIAVRFIFLTSLVLVFALLALLELLCLLFLAAAHLIHLLLLAALELVLALLVCILPAQPLLLLVLAPLHVLAFGILLPLHLVELLLVPLLQPWIGGRVVGMARRGRTIESAAVIVVAIAWAVRRVAIAVVKVSVAAIRIARVRRTVPVAAPAAVVESGSIINAATVIGSAVLDVSAMEIARARSCGDFGITVIDGVPEAAIAPGGFKVTILL